MDQFMLDNSQLVGKPLDALISGFNGALDRASAIWGDQIFQRWDGQRWRQQALAGLYDAEMIAASMLTDSQITAVSARRSDLLEATKLLFYESPFEEAVRLGTNTPSRIRYRIEQTHQMLISFT